MPSELRVPLYRFPVHARCIGAPPIVAVPCGRLGGAYPSAPGRSFIGSYILVSQEPHTLSPVERRRSQ